MERERGREREGETEGERQRDRDRQKNPLRLLFEFDITNHNYPRLEVLRNLIHCADAVDYIKKLRN